MAPAPSDSASGGTGRPAQRPAKRPRDTIED